MNKRARTKLSPLQKIIRNSVVNYLYRAGFTKKDIAIVMSMSQSTVTRVTSRSDIKQLRELTDLDE